jgi:putative ABC transport system ATP-binding protein
MEIIEDKCRGGAQVMEKHVVQMAGITKDYGEGAGLVHALKGIDLELHAGDFITLAGPSGSGKSTLLNLIGGLDRPTGGTMLFEGRDITRLGGSALSLLRKERIGFIFQAYNLIPVMTAYENAEYVLALQGVPPARRRAVISALFNEVGLEGLEDRFPRELSGGQQQRVAIVRAIAPSPALVLADEPTANVDSATGGALMDLMAKLNKEKGVTFLFSTHDPMVMERAHRRIILKDGRIGGDTR